VIRFLPFLLVPILIIAGLGYWRYTASQRNVNSPQAEESRSPVEVPKTLPGASLEDRIKSLEDTVTKLVPQVNNLKPLSSPAGSAGSTSLDSRLTNAESAVTDLKARVSALEKATPVPVTTLGKSTVYIPLGSGGSSGDRNWISNDNYGVTIDPAEYPGYSTMQLEVNFRMVQKSGTAYARLYNVTDSNAKEQVSTTLDSFSWQTSYGFNLPSGSKTYTLQTKSSEGAEIQLQSARIKVSF